MFTYRGEMPMKEKDMVPLIITVNTVVTAIILLALTFYVF